MSQAKMDALKELATKLKNKEAVEDLQLWKAAGFTGPKRLKDVEQAIVALRKQFSIESKERDADAERAEAEEAGLTVEEYREQIKAKRDTEHRQDKKRLDDERKAGRETKQLQGALARGEFDLKTDYVGGGDAGDDE